jgi:hypothetical protein
VAASTAQDSETACKQYDAEQTTQEGRSLISGLTCCGHTSGGQNDYLPHHALCGVAIHGTVHLPGARLVKREVGGARLPAVERLGHQVRHYAAIHEGEVMRELACVVHREVDSLSLCDS